MTLFSCFQNYFSPLVNKNLQNPRSNMTLHSTPRTRPNWSGNMTIAEGRIPPLSGILKRLRAIWGIPESPKMPDNITVKEYSTCQAKIFRKKIKNKWIFCCIVSELNYLGIVG